MVKKAKKVVKKAGKKLNVIVYSTQYCPWCHKAKEFLEAYGIEYVDKDVTNNKEFVIEMIKKSGQSGVPVIDVNGVIIIGFDELKLKELLNLNG